MLRNIVCDRLGASKSSLSLAQLKQGQVKNVASFCTTSATHRNEPDRSEHVRPVSTVQRGRDFEEHVLAFLEQTFSSAQLTRVGGAGDGGIDITGWWQIDEKLRMSSLPGRIRIMAQCKAESKKLGPIHIREIQGAFSARFGKGSEQEAGSAGGDGGEDSNSEHDQERHASPAVMAVLASSSGFSEKCLEQAIACPVPLLLLHLLHPYDVARFESDTKKTSSTDGQLMIPPSRFTVWTFYANDALQKKVFDDKVEVKWLLRPDKINGRKIAHIGTRLYPRLSINGTLI